MKSRAPSTYSSRGPKHDLWFGSQDACANRRAKPRYIDSTGARAVAVSVLLGSVLGALPASAQELPRAKIVLPNVVSVDLALQAVTVPLHRGYARRQTVWYIVTDSSDRTDATMRGAIYAPKLSELEAGCSACIEHAHERNGEITFAAMPDFSKRRAYVPGPAGFPPNAAAPGSTAPGSYSPFVRLDSAMTVINAPIVATGTGAFDVATHSNTLDRVLAIDPLKMTVTLLLTHGFANSKAVLYISTEASDPGVASIERATFAPSLRGATDGTIPVYAVANGPADNETNAQGLAFVALFGKLSADATLANASTLRSANNVLGSFPTGADPESYTPLWSANLGFWSDAAASEHVNLQLRSPRGFTEAADSGKLTGPEGKKFGPIGVNVNCEVIGYLDEAP